MGPPTRLLVSTLALALGGCGGSSGGGGGASGGASSVLPATVRDDPSALWRIPPPGRYPCRVLTGLDTELQVRPDPANPGGTVLVPVNTPRYGDSFLGELTLEPDGDYRTTAGYAGRYRYDERRERLAFDSGALAGYPVQFGAAVSNGIVGYSIDLSVTTDDGTIQVQLCAGSAPLPDGAVVTVSPFEGTVTSGDGVFAFEFDLASGERTPLGQGIQPQRTFGGELIRVVGLPGAESFVVTAADGSERTVEIPFFQNDPASRFHDRLDPALSPDGSLIAFAARPLDPGDGLFSVADASYHVYVIDRAGAVLADIRGYAQPVWTPDGRALVMAGGAPLTLSAGESGIYLADLGAGSIARLDDGLAGAVHPAVSPDGRRVAFLHDDALWLVGTDGSGQVRLGTSDTPLAWPAFSPEGDAVAVIRHESPFRELVVVPLDGRATTTVRDPSDAAVGAAERLSWR